MIEPGLRKPLLIWLLLMTLLVWGMIVLGGVTRLTESGLSIVEWKPVTGIFPPMSEEGWQKELAEYRTSPQYQKINRGMSVSEFKQIYWLEYLHRLLGRLIGVFFLLPMLYFFIRYTLPGWLKWRLVGLFLLGGLQGVIGWYMVKSGLIDQPMVSPYRLALHLGTAFLIIGLLVWTALEVRYPNDSREHLLNSAPRSGPFIAGMIVLLIFLQVVFGALVAGLDAGLIYNTFPLMDGRWIPKGLYIMEPEWRNHFENVTMVQFQHRVLAMVLGAILLLFAAWMARDAIYGRLSRRFMLLLIVFAAQFALGVSTLVLNVPLMLASMHQAVAAILFAFSIWIWYAMRYGHGYRLSDAK